MTSGLGISIGTVNVVSARVGEYDARPIVRTRRTAVGFDDRGSARLGGITRFSTAVSEFADLGRDPESVYVDGRIWSPTTIFASVVQGLVAAEPAAGVVATHPAGYSAKQLDLLRQSLDLAGAGHVQLVPEPVAAAHWLDTEHGPLDTGFVLVYDLGGNSLDVAVVRTGLDWPDHPVVGKPVRSYEFGGRPLGAMIARCAGDRAIGPAEPGTGAVSLMSFVDPEGLRREHIRDSLEVVRGAVRSAGVALSDIGRILVVGGAARPPQVAETLAELGLPVTIAADSAHCVALGAAAMAAESVPLAASSRGRHAPIFSGAAVFSAVAMSAATILGNGAADTVVPDQDRMPLQTPGAVLYEIHGEAQVERSGTGWSVSYAPLNTGPRIVPAGVSRPYGPPMPGAAAAPAKPAPGHDGDRADSHTSPRDRHADNESRYSDPARFRNPIPFERPGIPARPDPGPAEPEAPGGELPGSPDPDDTPVVDPPGEQPGGETDEPEPGSDNGAGSAPGLPDTGNPGVPEVPGGSWSGGDESPGGNWSAPGSEWSEPGGGWSAPEGPGDTPEPGSGDDGSGAGTSDGSGAGDPGGVGTGNPGGYGTGVPGGYGTGDSGGYGMGDSGGFGSGGSGAGDSGGFGGGGFGGSDSGPGGISSGGSDSSGGSNTNSGGFGGFGGSRSSAGDSDSSGSDSSKGSKSRGSDSGGSSSSGSDGASSRGKGSRGKSSGGGSDN
ncbi:Hsp70 family protein [Nocardia carnea]|uniref:Hsp70 family protein n=1 Tax=Nocardia carnea TaxID=37328 RepID=UPI00245403C4|nr:Hsp70 family protein [Nocardia carnea]